MCGIVGAIAQRDVTEILLEGLRRLEYRGYDSAGLAIINSKQELQRIRSLGKVIELEKITTSEAPSGNNGIAHTRWATHGKPSESNAHPHVCNNKVALVHNGIIENHEALREAQTDYSFTSETDTETVVHQVCKYLDEGHALLAAVQSTTQDIEGAYALAVISPSDPDIMIAACHGSPLVIGIGVGEYFIASDIAALIPVTQQYIVLHDGDIVEITRQGITIYDDKQKVVERKLRVSELNADSVDKGDFRHFMLKEIYEQPEAISNTLEGRIHNDLVIEQSFGVNATEVFDKVKSVQIIACGTSYHAGLIARYWFEALAGIPCVVEVASEFRYRRPVVNPDALVITISQSGETSDTLAALKEAQRLGFGPSLSICNVPESPLVRASDLCLMTRAGPEIGVASTKAFTTQLVGLMLLVLVLGRRQDQSEKAIKKEQAIVRGLMSLPRLIEEVLKLDNDIQRLAEDFSDKHHALFVGRGAQYPVAMEGALKLKEISYIHAEAYPAGELKHGPLALVDDSMPVIAVAPNNELMEKLKTNIHEVRARDGRLYIFADKNMQIEPDENLTIIPIVAIDDCIAPVLYTVPLQLFSYYVARLKGTDIDQPRNLAKSVCVE
ncbi:Glutamine--fructose-6-phosphate aminotransferase [isomerizing] [hydrothermal vent metagenome]|uniref:Glutamine--fructose-6-phosphate aminotransferase [isomerizing] n=1 Tax=hydrothermal vent metagenome TaxID=652676 RepID=A0A3B0ZCD6_9ZZZZ